MSSRPRQETEMTRKKREIRPLSDDINLLLQNELGAAR
jgi:hypothetical protein